MGKDYVPTSNSNLKTWLAGLKAALTTDGPALGRTPAQITADNDFIDTMLAPVTSAETAATAAMEAEGLARLAMTTNNKPLRDLINNCKSSPGWNSGRAAAWKVQSGTTQYDMDTHKPTLTVKLVGGSVLLGGSKPGFDAVSIDMRVTGTATWTTIAVKVMRLPVIDSTAPQVPGKPESRDYRGRGYVADQEMGQPSDIVTNIFPG